MNKKEKKLAPIEIAFDRIWFLEQEMKIIKNCLILLAKQLVVTLPDLYEFGGE